MQIMLPRASSSWPMTLFSARKQPTRLPIFFRFATPYRGRWHRREYTSSIFNGVVSWCGVAMGRPDIECNGNPSKLNRCSKCEELYARSKR